MTSPSTMLQIRNLSIHGSGRTLVRDLSLTVPRGHTLALLGESGSGKSLSALAIMGLLPSGLSLGSASRVFFAGDALPLHDDAAMRAFRGRRLAIIFQDPMACLNPFMRVGSQIEEALTRLGVRASAERKSRVLELLREVELPEPSTLARRYPHELSGGQQQRIMIAMALAGEPDLLIADEPTSALDATVQAEIVKLLADLQRRRQMAMLFITHDLAVAAALAHDVAIMRAGELVECGQASSVLSTPKHSYTERLVSARRQLLAHRPKSAWSGPDSGRPPLSRKEPALQKGPGAHLDSVKSQCSPITPVLQALPSKGDPLVVLKRVSIDYPARNFFGAPFRAVKDATFDLRAGRTLGILGESGSGKSTIAASVAGLRRPCSGRINVLGCELTPKRWQLPPALRRRCQLIFQNPYGALNPRLTIERLMSEPLRLANTAPAACRERVADVLSEVGLDASFLARYPHQLSGGQRQRICIARALLCRPDLLICDEVVSALDMTVQVQILALLKRLQQEHGFGMLFVGHDIDVVRWIADDILVMHQGAIVDRLGVDDLFDPARHEFTRRLVAARPGRRAA
ncbi:ABC transporter ATP-binding protein [Bradyrhizobium sp. LHD-71]|uniref:ABC transporter ATP-binding protein n=1 Tax=Bradyrhizobium sp. LHD-71 TaxID=3072141 RepID=UPI00280D2CAF|nr:ABC transporter ATP-binding protein [Bradyrhizobium sp. LHD-71]MDQ8732347.1 ABC transporter ATP-binding protein [Bradyrhizobium sp. LHD-71]